MSSQPQSGKSFRSLLGLPDSNPTPPSSVLIIVDAQNEYDHGLLAIHEVQKSRNAIGEVLEKWRNGGGEVVHILHKVPEGAPLFTPGTELAEEFKELKPREGEKVIYKPHPCAFTDTPLDAHLKQLGKSKIVLVGYMVLPILLASFPLISKISDLLQAHVCISATSRIGAELGYDVSVVSDAIGDRDIPGAKAGQLVDTVLAELGDVSATIVKSGDL